MTQDATGRDWWALSEPLALALIVGSVVASVLGLIQPDSLGMAPLIGALLLLLLGRLPRQPLAGGWLLLLLLSLRVTLRGSDRYLPQEISLNDYLLVLAAAAACLEASRSFWAGFQGLCAGLVPLAGGWAWLQQGASGAVGALAAGSLTAAQSAMVFGLCLCLSIPRVVGCAGAGDPGRWRQRLGWGLLTLLSAGLTVASGGAVTLVLVTLALAGVRLLQWSRVPGTPGRRRLRACLTMIALLAAAAAASLLSGPAAVAAGSRGLGERLALLGCFLHTPFSQVERLFLGVGLTNSSSWLCQAVRPLDRLIQADNLPAQIAADQGLIALLALAALVAWLVARSGQLQPSPAEALTLAGLTAALFTLLTLLNGNGWGQSTLLQVLIGMQLGWFGRPREERP